MATARHSPAQQLFFAVALAATIAFAATAQTTTPTVTEKATGVALPTTRPDPVSGRELALTGTGVRIRYALFKVYAFGFYVDRLAAQKELARWAGKSADELRKDVAFHQAVVALPADRLALMHFVRSVDAKAMREAMTDAMNRHVPPNDPARAAFLALWTEPVKSGEDVALVFGADGKVTLVRGPKTVGAVDSALLARSLLESWLGPKPISDDLCAGVVERFPALLK